MYLFSALSIGHKHLPGFQRVISRPFLGKRYRGSNRQDLVFVRPSDSGKDFHVSINPVWYCPVLLLFSFYTSTDYGIERHNCAFVSESVFLWCPRRVCSSYFIQTCECRECRVEIVGELDP
jgi:hypothetical protein